MISAINLKVSGYKKITQGVFMKKLLGISLLVLVLILAVLAGGVYANNPGKIESGNKLVGLGILGSNDDPDFGKTRTASWIVFTNPDPVNGIKITKFSVIRQDGTIMYEGPYLKLSPPPPGEIKIVREIITEIGPHEIWGLGMFNWMYKGGEITDPDSWYDMWEAYDQAGGIYTVEIHWQPSTKAPTCALIGWEQQTWTCDPPSGALNWSWPTARTESPLINVKYGK
jgi:hypothetical protein